MSLVECLVYGCSWRGIFLKISLRRGEGYIRVGDQSTTYEYYSSTGSGCILTEDGVEISRELS